MAKWLFAVCSAYFVFYVHGTFQDELRSVEKDLADIESKSLAKKSLSDEKASILVELLKKELLLQSNTKSDGKIKDNDAAKKREEDAVSSNEVVAETSEVTTKKEVSSDEFFKNLESRNDDFDNDPQAKRAIEMMTKDMVTMEMRQADPNKCSNTTDKCCDKIRNCKFIAKKNLCHVDKRIPNLCPKSCNYCKLAAPPKCRKTKFGCCWDKVTPKLDVAGKNCPKCVDDYKYMCKTFLTECSKISKAGQFMRQHCKKSCKFCDENCKDDKRMAFYCGFWKNDLKWCDSMQETMMHFCPVTCGFC